MLKGRRQVGSWESEGREVLLRNPAGKDAAKCCLVCSYDVS
jgi:hypothetical protein